MSELQISTQSPAHDLTPNLTQELAEQIAHELTHGEQIPIAFLVRDQTIYFSRAEMRAHTPYSPVVHLIQGIYDLDPLNAFRFVRKRIYTTARLTPMCLGMVKVAAQRVSELSRPRDHQLKFHFDLREIIPRKMLPSALTQLFLNQSPIRFQSVPEAMNHARALTHQVSQAEQRYESDRPIAALLLSRDLKLLEFAVNTNARNRTLHAEVNLIQTYYARTGSAVPSDSFIISTRKPCRMCAGMIWHCAEDIQNLNIIYDEEDTGPNARSTILNAESYDRKRFVSAPHLISLQPEKRLTESVAKARSPLDLISVI